MLITHVETLSKEGIVLKNVYLVYNYDLEEYSVEVERILSFPKLKRKLARYNIEPIGFPEIILLLEEKMGATV